MSDVDNCNSLVAQAGGIADPAPAIPGAITAVWVIAANRSNGTRFHVQVDQNSCFWTIVPASAAYAVVRGQGSPDLERAMKRLGML
jgi:hypothetical protein